MSLSLSIQETENLPPLEAEMNTQTNVDGPLHLVDPSVYYDSVNGMDYDAAGNLYFGGTLCGRSSAELSTTFDCELTSQSGTESTLSFAPSYVAVMDNEGIRTDANLFHSGYGD